MFPYKLYTALKLERRDEGNTVQRISTACMSIIPFHNPTPLMVVHFHDLHLVRTPNPAKIRALVCTGWGERAQGHDSTMFEQVGVLTYN